MFDIIVVVVVVVVVFLSSQGPPPIKVKGFADGIVLNNPSSFGVQDTQARNARHSN